MKQIPLTKGKFALVDDEDYEFLMQWRWVYHSSGYATRTERPERINGKRKLKVHLMHRVIVGTPEGKLTDHVNGNKLDNRRSNLRVCTNAQNCMNRGSNGHTTSKFKGVSWKSANGKWQAQIMAKNKVIYLGLFAEEVDAATAYNLAALEYHKEFANYNKAA